MSLLLRMASSDGDSLAIKGVREIGPLGMYLALPKARRLLVDSECQVLVVEDEASLRRSLKKYLERAGYAFECCATAREALALAERLDPAIVIAEYRLPDANGLVLLEQLKRILPEVAAILLSEYDFEAVAKDSNHVGVWSFLKKPFDLVELEAALSSARSKAKLTSVENIGEGPELGFEGIPGFTVE